MLCAASRACLRRRLAVRLLPPPTSPSGDPSAPPGHNHPCPPPPPPPPPPFPPPLLAAVPHERDQWQQPVEAYAISERGKAAAAVELAKQLQGRIKTRGCREEFVAKAELLEQGLVRF